MMNNNEEKKYLYKTQELNNILFDYHNLLFSENSRIHKYNMKLYNYEITNDDYNKKNFDKEVKAIFDIFNYIDDNKINYKKYIKETDKLVRFNRTLYNLSYRHKKYKDYFKLVDDDEDDFEECEFYTEYTAEGIIKKENNEPLRAFLNEIRTFTYFKLKSQNFYDFNLYKNKEAIFKLETTVNSCNTYYRFRGNNGVEIQAIKDNADNESNDLIIKYFCSFDKEDCDRPIFKGEGYKSLCIFVNRIFKCEDDLTENSKVCLQIGNVIPFFERRIKFDYDKLLSYYKSKGFMPCGEWLIKPITTF